MRWGLVAAAAGAVAFGGAFGCKKDENGKDEAKPEKKEEPPPAPPPSAASNTGDVTTYPNQVNQGGARIIKKPFSVFSAADFSSTKLGGVAQGTLVNLKASLGDWTLIEWPSGPGTLSPGWIRASVNDQSALENAPPGLVASAFPKLIPSAAPSASAAASAAASAVASAAPSATPAASADPRRITVDRTKKKK
jgi:hypothetical protein